MLEMKNSVDSRRNLVPSEGPYGSTEETMPVNASDLFTELVNLLEVISSVSQN